MDFEPVPVKLRDGTPLVIREIRHDDADSLRAMHGRLSDYSLQMRYLSTARQPLDGWSARTCNVEPKAHMVLVAVPSQVQPEQIVAVAEYAIPDRAVPCSAEVGIVVEDAYQHRGLGRAILMQLVVIAQAQGICELTADIAHENQAILVFLRKTSLPHQAWVSDGLIHLSIELTQNLVELKEALVPLQSDWQPGQSDD